MSFDPNNVNRLSTRIAEGIREDLEETGRTPLQRSATFRKWRFAVDQSEAPRRHRTLSLLVKFAALCGRSIYAVIYLAVARAPARMRWYLAGMVATLALVWAIVGGYLLISSPSFTTRWTLILPTAASSVSLQLELIGHAQSIPSSPFGSSTLSPKVIYKEIVSSERVRHAAATSLGMTLAQFGAARVKLIDETALMMFEISGPSPTLAQRKANALIAAFHAQLDTLRRDEIQRRTDVVKESLKTYEANLKSARSRILQHQQTTGMLTVNQFNEASSSRELMRRRLAEVKAELARLEGEKIRLAGELRMTPVAAAAMLRLSADPVFVKLAGDLGELRARIVRDDERIGRNNPMLAMARGRLMAVRRHLSGLARSAGVGDEIEIERALLVMNGTHRSDLAKGLVAADAAIAGRAKEVAMLEAELVRLDDAVKRMSADAARLEDLRKDHLVAEAVFTSALARLGTNRADIYASYPMVQTLADPDLPGSRSSPRLILAILGGLVISLLVVGAWGTAWLRKQVFLAHAKNG